MEMHWESGRGWDLTVIAMGDRRTWRCVEKSMICQVPVHGEARVGWRDEKETWNPAED